MADSKRLITKKALTDLLAGITVANGFQHDLTGKVWRGRTRIGDETSAPFLTIIEVIPNPPSTAGADTNKNIWELAIKGYAVADQNNPTDTADNLMADVKKRLALIADDGGRSAPGPDYLLGGLVTDIEVDNGVTFEPEETSKLSAFVLKVSFGFVEKLGDVYET